MQWIRGYSIIFTYILWYSWKKWLYHFIYKIYLRIIYLFFIRLMREKTSLLVSFKSQLTFLKFPTWLIIWAILFSISIKKFPNNSYFCVFYFLLSVDYLMRVNKYECKFSMLSYSYLFLLLRIFYLYIFHFERIVEQITKAEKIISNYFVLPILIFTLSLDILFQLILLYIIKRFQ